MSGSALQVAHKIRDALLRRQRGLAFDVTLDLDELLEDAAFELEDLHEHLASGGNHYVCGDDDCECSCHEDSW